jgi:glycosyltransferase involved in cell wall biosynthesis
MKKRAVFWVHDPGAPSFRHRLAAHMPALEAAGISCEVEVFPRRRYGARVLGRLRRLREHDILVIAKMKLEAGERALVRRAARRIVYDFDDAIYFAKPDRPGREPDRSPRRVAKFRRMCELADLVIAGNETLAARARAHCRRLEVVPTAIDASAYAPRHEFAGLARTLVWIGMRGNLPYLELVEEAVAGVCREFPGLRLRIVSEGAPAKFDAPHEVVPWAEETEARVLSESDIGLMPLTDDDWTRGKGAFKLLQYMAAGLPSVASPVGMNREVIVDGANGYFAETTAEWFSALRSLVADPDLRKRLGARARRDVEARYDRPAASRRIVGLFQSLLSDTIAIGERSC